MATTVKTTKTGAVALHNSSSCEGGDSHAVALLSLKVMITEEEGYWFAQCLEIDYATDGESVEDVTARFEDGLEKAIDVHLHEFGSLDNLLKPAPSKVLMEFNEKFTRLYSQVSKHFTEQAEGTIRYYEAA
ncbi:MAG: hypothetical protein ABI779_12510 [Acidobacteriota bacterium]